MSIQVILNRLHEKTFSLRFLQKPKIMVELKALKIVTNECCDQLAPIAGPDKSHGTRAEI